MSAADGAGAAVSEPRELTAGQRRRVVAFATMGTLLDGADFAIFLVFLVPIATYFDVSVLTISAIHATSYVVGIVGGLLFGILADRRGRRVALAGAIATFSVFTLLSAFVPNPLWLLIARVLAGIGIGGESGVAFALINEAYPGRSSRRGLRSGLVQTMFIFGNFLAFGVFQFTTALYDDDAWRWAFFYLGCAGVLAFFVRLWMPESAEWQRARQLCGDDSGQQSTRRIFAELLQGALLRRVLLSTALMSMAFFGAYAVITYAPSMWQAVYDLAPQTVAMVGYIGSIAAIIGYTLNGFLSDYIGRRRAFLLFGVVGAAAYVLFGLVALVVQPSVVAATIWVSPVFFSFLLMQFGYGYHGSQGVWLSELYPTRVRATAQNLVYYVGRAVGAGLLPLLGLAVAESLGGDFRLAIAFGVIGAAGTALAALTLPETKGTDLRG